MYRKWNIHTPDKNTSRELAEQAQMGKLLASVLVARGYETKAAVDQLLAEENTLPDPLLIKDISLAADRINKAIEQEEPMVIFGDYDVDGITATALLYSYLDSLGAQVFYKLPNRATDEYGLTPSTVDEVADKGIQLIITVDNGTSALEAAARAQERGVELVITDHHLPPETLPQVTALVNPCREDDSSPYKNLSGVGVAYMLAAAIEGCPAEELLPHLSDFAAIGTVADVMKLTGPNRILVRNGLAALQHTHRPGLVALIENCGLSGKNVTAENISYAIAPRINAAGRMDDATHALRLLLAESQEEAEELVLSLQEHNMARQKAEGEMVTAIAEQIEQTPELLNARVLVVAGDGWHQGVVGIVASRLVDRYAKPAVVISFDGEDGRGSGRSTAGFSLHGAISSCGELLTRFGGHDLAAGLSIKRENLERFRQRINQWALENCPVPQAPVIEVDAPIGLQDISVEEVRQLERLDPCGSGNPGPRFCLQDVILDVVYPVSEGRHSRLRLKQGNNTLYAVLFGIGPEQLAYLPGDRMDALITLSIYQGRGEAQVSARVIELRPSGLGAMHIEQSALFESFSTGWQPSKEQIQLLHPSREDTAAVYRALRTGRPVSYQDLRPLFYKLGEELTGRMLTSLAALEELGLIARDPEKGCYKVLPVDGKKDLASSKMLRRLEV